MTFNDTVSNQGICQDIDFLVNTDTTIYPLRDKARNVNKYLHRAYDIFRLSNTGQQLRDPANTASDVYTIAFTADQKTATSTTALPAVINAGWRILRVEAPVDAAANDSRLLKNITQQQIPIAKSDFYEQSGTPIFYEMIGDEFRLYPAPSYAMNLSVYVEDVAQEFSGDNSAGDNSKVPPIPVRFHRYLAYGGAYEYALGSDIQKANAFRQEMEQMEREMEIWGRAIASRTHRTVFSTGAKGKGTM